MRDKMTLLRPDTVYRSIELVFEGPNLDAALDRMAKQVKDLFTRNGFKHAQITIDVRNPSTKKME